MVKSSNHGGKRKGAGRKSRIEEAKIKEAGLSAINKVYGGLEGFYLHIAKESKTSFPHLKLLKEYVFGKPKESVEINDITEDKPQSILNFKNYQKDN